jgi:hypothetical protein
MVPSDPTYSLARRRHARLELCRRSRLRWLLGLPATVFGGDGSMPGKLARLFRLEPVSRGSLSLPRNEGPFPGCHSGIDVSGLPLRCLAERSTGPFGLGLLRSHRLAPVWARSAPQTRSLLPVLQFRPLLGSPLPFGSFGPSGSKRSTRFPTGKLAFRTASGSPSLPAAGSIGIVTATDQRSRSVSLPGGSLFLEPLGTKCYIAPGERLPSNQFCDIKRDFLRIVRIYFVAVTRQRRWMICG